MEHVPFVELLSDLLNRVGDLQDIQSDCAEDGESGTVVVTFPGKNVYEINFKKIQ